MHDKGFIELATVFVDNSDIVQDTGRSRFVADGSVGLKRNPVYLEPAVIEPLVGCENAEIDSHHRHEVAIARCLGPFQQCLEVRHGFRRSRTFREPLLNRTGSKPHSLLVLGGEGGIQRFLQRRLLLRDRQLRCGIEQLLYFQGWLYGSLSSLRAKG